MYLFAFDFSFAVDYKIIVFITPQLQFKLITPIEVTYSVANYY